MPDFVHASSSTSNTLQPPASSHTSGSPSRTMLSPPSPSRPARPRSIPIYVRIVPNDQWLRLHVPLGATMGSVKDNILTRAKFPRTRPAALDHLPKAIISYTPNKDLRSLAGTNPSSPAGAPNLPSSRLTAMAAMAAHDEQPLVMSPTSHTAPSGLLPAASEILSRSQDGQGSSFLTAEPANVSPSRPRSRTINAGDAAVRALGAIIGRARGKSRTKEKEKDRASRDQAKAAAGAAAAAAESDAENQRKRDRQAFAASQTRSDIGVRSSSSHFIPASQPDPMPEGLPSPRSHLTPLQSGHPTARRSASSPYPPRAPSTGAAAASNAGAYNETGGAGASGSGGNTTGRSSTSNSIGSAGEHSTSTSTSAQAGAGGSGWTAVSGMPSSPEGTSGSAGAGYASALPKGGSSRQHQGNQTASPYHSHISLRADNTITVSVPESSTRLQQETGGTANLLSSLASMRLGGIATEKISIFDSGVTHPLSKAFGLYSYANGGAALEDWKTVAACNLRPWELLEVQWCNDGVGIGIGETMVRSAGLGGMGSSDIVLSSLVASPSGNTTLGLDQPFEADVSFASTTITRDTSTATFRTDDDDALGPLPHPESRTLNTKRSILDSPGKRSSTAPQSIIASGSSRASISGIGISGADDDADRLSNDSASALNFSSGVTEAIRPLGPEMSASGTMTPAVPFDGPPLGLGAGRVCLPRETWGPGTSQSIARAGGASASPSIDGAKLVPFDSTYAQPFFETWVYVYKPSAKALSKAQKGHGLGVWKRRWLVICGWRMGLLRKKEGRSVLLGRWLSATSQAASTALVSSALAADDGVSFGMGIMTSAGIDVEQGVAGDGEFGTSALPGTGKAADSAGGAAPDASAPASVPTYFLDALRAVTTDHTQSPPSSTSQTARFEENLPADRISLAFQPGGSRDPKGFGAAVDPSYFSHEPASALHTLTHSTSFTSNLGSALTSGVGSHGKSNENGIMLLHLRCISAHDHSTLLHVFKRALANKPGASLGAGLFSPSAAAMSAGNAAGVGFAAGITSLGVGTWRRSAVIRATIAGRGGTVQPGKPGRRQGRNAFARMRTRPSGMPTELDNADDWSSGSEEEGPNGMGIRLKQGLAHSQSMTS
ncbi:hypothetical protein OC842_001772 [Tilletia horrida]|uniref:Uncharacterized protein n=1 Tax=Tilletia horrida TaxID=155126 RepID=A0AAN6JLP1_9BASI|nr:hypothetical protein OC842_001772 [Tilletia horrida]